MEIVQIEFRDGVIPEEAAWHAVVLIPKGGGYYCNIGLVEVIWKAVPVILDHHFTTNIAYHDFLHGFWVGHGTGTATLELNLLQQVAALRESVLHAIFLELQKAYYALDRSRYLGILEGCGVGTRSLRLL